MICMNVTYVCPLIQKQNKNIKEKKKKKKKTGLLPMPLALLMCLMVSSVEGLPPMIAPTGAMS
jgi:hypothetical protein